MQVRSCNFCLPHSSVISQLSLKTKSFPRAYKVLPSLVQHCVWMLTAFYAPCTWLHKPLPSCSWTAASTLCLRAFVLAVPSACNALPPTRAWFAPLLLSGSCTNALLLERLYFSRLYKNISNSSISLCFPIDFFFSISLTTTWYAIY